jgi:hypothetical protein
MPYTLKPHDDEARARLRAFWAGGSLGRPALQVFVDAHKPAGVWPGPAWSAKERDLEPAWHTWATRDALGRVGFLAEAMPAFHVGWGSFLTTLAVVAGGDYTYHDSAWILPIADLYDRPLPVFDPAHPVVQRIDACFDAVIEAVGDAGFVTPPLMMDGLSTLSMFREADVLCLEMLDRPEEVRAWASALNTLYIDIYEHYYRRIGAGASWCFFGPVAEGRSEGVQCDFAVNLSPAMYADFVIPDLRRVTDYLDFSLYHLDGVCQLRFLDQLAALPGLTGIQWNPETTAGAPTDWIDAFREIRRRGLCLMIGTGVDQAIAVTKALGPDGLFFALPTFASDAEARAAIAAIQAAC